jgi:hypothetical protein
MQNEDIPREAVKRYAHSFMDPIIQRHRFPEVAEAELPKRVPGLSEGELRGLVFELAMEHVLLQTWTEYPKELTTAYKLFGVNLKAVETKTGKALKQAMEEKAQASSEEGPGVQLKAPDDSRAWSSWPRSFGQEVDGARERPPSPILAGHAPEPPGLALRRRRHLRRAGLRSPPKGASGFAVREIAAPVSRATK